MKEETLLHPGKPPTLEDLPGQASLGGEHGGQGMEGGTDGQRARAGRWNLGFGDQNQREVGGWLCRDRQRRVGGWNPVQPWLGVFPVEIWATLETSDLSRVHVGRGGTQTAAFFPVCTLAEGGHCLHGLQGLVTGHKLPPQPQEWSCGPPLLPAQTPGQMPLPPSHGAGVLEPPAATENPRTGHQPPHLHTTCQAANHQHVPGKRRPASILKTALHLIHQTHTSYKGTTPREQLSKTTEDNCFS